VEALAKDLGAKIVTVQALEEDLERKWSMGLEKEVRQEVQGIRKSAATLAQTLKGVQEQVEKIREEVGEIQTRTDEWVKTFETQLPQIWRAEFLDPASDPFSSASIP
jgi:predicted  nucleic acid-binding Zn-ribbon protein